MNREIVMKLREELKEDVLQRYNTPEYWNAEIIESFIQEHQLNNEEAEALRKEIVKEDK
jgi:hypothetical protein